VASAVALLALGFAWVRQQGLDSSPGKEPGPRGDREGDAWDVSGITIAGHTRDGSATGAAPHASAHAGDALQWLLQPVAKEEWRRAHWEQRPLHVRRAGPVHAGSQPDPSPFYARSSGGFADVDSILSIQSQVKQTPLLVHPTTGVSQADCSAVVKGMDNKRHEFRSVHAAYLNGATIVCNIVPAYWRPLALLMDDLGASTGFQWLANMYLSPRGAQGFTDHTDNKDGIIIQVGGAKRWVVHEGIFRNPLRHQMVGRPHEKPAGHSKGVLLFNSSLGTGDLLYVPRGCVHHASSGQSMPSLHYTISATKNMEWVDFLDAYVAAYPRTGLPSNVLPFVANVLPQAIRAESETKEGDWVRASLPFHYREQRGRAQLEAELASILAKLKGVMEARLARQLAAQPGAKAGFDAAFALLTQGDGGAIDGVLKKDDVYHDYVERLLEHGRSNGNATSAALVTGASVLEVVGALGVTATRAGGRLVVATAHAKGKLTMRWTPELKHSVDWLLRRGTDGGATTVDAIPGNDPFEKIALVRELTHIGVLQIVPTQAV